CSQTDTQHIGNTAYSNVTYETSSRYVAIDLPLPQRPCGSIFPSQSELLMWKRGRGFMEQSFSKT
ncbi:hypothetical protein J6590_106608, partial [Homalodisca vitripennis]